MYVSAHTGKRYNNHFDRAHTAQEHTHINHNVGMQHMSFKDRHA